MKKNYGQLLDEVLRKEGVNMKDLAKHLDVARSTLYLWIGKQFIDPQILYRIGCVINHDFSIEFPEHFDPTDFNIPGSENRSQLDKSFWNASDAILWKDKYLALLEKHNILLSLKLEPQSGDNGKI